MAKTGKKPTHKILALRGYLNYLRDNKKLASGDRLAKLNDVMPLVKRPDEKKLACAVLGKIPSDAALAKLTTLTAEGPISEEACWAIVELCQRKDLKGASKGARKKALQTAVQKFKNRRAKKTAQNLLNAVK